MLLLNKANIKFCIALLFIAGQGCLLYAQITTYTIDSEKSKITFRIKHLGILNVEGAFKNFEGELNISSNKLLFTQCKIDVKSISTEDNSRDKTLIDEGYLNADEFPYITFTSLEVLKDSIVGKLKI